LTEAGDWSVKTLSYTFRDPALLEQALTHRSASGPHNERLEFLGDAVLGAAIAAALWERRPEADEGLLSRYRASLVRRETLAAIAREADLGARLHLGSGEARTGGQQRASVLANALEAVFGAVFVDGGFDASRNVIMGLFAPLLDHLPPAEELIDAKTALQEYLQARGVAVPEYCLDGVSGAAHSQMFRARCRIAELALETTGTGRSRRKAEQHAAARALAQLDSER